MCPNLIGAQDGSRPSADFESTVDRQALESMLKHGAYNVFAEDEEEGDKKILEFCDADIETILARSTVA